MKQWLNLGLLIAFLLCWLEWPPNNALFVFEAEWDVFANVKGWGSSFTHPIVLFGLLSQLILLYGAMRKNAPGILNHIGVALHTLVVLLFFAVGLLSNHPKIFLSTLPFLALAFIYFVKFRKS